MVEVLKKDLKAQAVEADLKLMLLDLQGWSTIIVPLKNLSLLIRRENESLYGIFDSAVRCKSTFRSEPLWPIFDFGPPLPV